MCHMYVGILLLMLGHMLHVSSSSQVTCDLAFIHTMYTDNMCMADTNVPVPFKALCLGLPAKRCTGGDNSSWRQGWRRQRAPCSITSRSCIKMCVCVCACLYMSHQDISRAGVTQADFAVYSTKNTTIILPKDCPPQIVSCAEINPTKGCIP